MKVICAWCQYVIREDDFSGLPTSHGICEKCRDIYYPKGGKRHGHGMAARVTAAPASQGLAMLSAGESAGPFCHWPKIQLAF